MPSFLAEEWAAMQAGELRAGLTAERDAQLDKILGRLATEAEARRAALQVHRRTRPPTLPGPC